MLVLASKSPRREQMLRAAGIPFVGRASSIAEERRAGESPVDYVCRLAEEKACAVTMLHGEVVLGADTVVVVDGEMLEKPRDSVDALRMLELLSGREHEVITGICLRAEARKIVDTASTKVRFAALTGEERDTYVESGEPMDKAGGYAIQGLASKFVEHIEGCYFNVVGLPVALVYRYLKELGAGSMPRKRELE